MHNPNLFTLMCLSMNIFHTFSANTTTNFTCLSMSWLSVVIWSQRISVRVARLTFFRPNFKLVDLKDFSWPFGLISSWLALKIRLAFWLFFGLFQRKILLFYFFRQHNWKIFVINAILDRRPRSDISNIWGMRVSK